MPSVAPETSALLHRPHQTGRASSRDNQAADGAFATMIDSQEPERGHTKRSAPADKAARKTDAASAPDRPEAASGNSEPKADDAPVSADNRAEGAPAGNSASTATSAENIIGIWTGDVADVKEQTDGPVPGSQPLVALPETLPLAALTPTVAPLPAIADSDDALAGTDADTVLSAAAAGEKSSASPALLAANGKAAAQASQTAPDGSNEQGSTDQTGEGGDTPKTASQIKAETETAPQREPTQKPSLSPNAQAEIKADDVASAAKQGSESIQPPMTPAPAHSASATTATPQAAPASAAQPVPVNALAVEIAAQARAGNSRFEIRLDPPELGRIDVRLDIDSEGNVSSRLVIDRSDTYDLLRRDQSTLERALQQAGLKTSDNALEFSLRDQGFAQRQDNGDAQRGGAKVIVQDSEILPAEAANGYARLIGGRGGIDIRV